MWLKTTQPGQTAGFSLFYLPRCHFGTFAKVPQPFGCGSKSNRRGKPQVRATHFGLPVFWLPQPYGYPFRQRLKGPATILSPQFSLLASRQRTAPRHSHFSNRRSQLRAPGPLPCTPRPRARRCRPEDLRRPPAPLPPIRRISASGAVQRRPGPLCPFCFLVSLLFLSCFNEACFRCFKMF